MSHGEPLGFWCRKCSSLACGLCIYEAHRQEDHVISPTKKILEEKKQYLEKEASKFKHTIDTTLLFAIRRSVVDIMKLVRKSTEIAELKVEMGKNGDLILVTSSMETLLMCEAKHHSLQNALENKGVLPGNTTQASGGREDIRPPVDYSSQFPDNKSHSTATTSKQRVDVGPLACRVRYSEAHCGYLIWDGKDFVLQPSISKPRDAHFTVTVRFLLIKKVISTYFFFQVFEVISISC